MYVWTHYCVLLFFLKCYISHPFISKTLLRTCSYHSSVGDKNTRIYTSKLYKLEDSGTGFVIYYTLCGYLPENVCGSKVAACLKYKESFHVLGKKFVVGDSKFDVSLKSVDGHTCKSKSGDEYKVTITFGCNEEMEEAVLERKSECEYNIHMIDPKCSLTCVTTIDHELVDIRGLKGNYFVKSKERNFSIALCGAKQECTDDQNSDISVCEKHTGGMIPLSSSRNERIVYNHQKNEIAVRGSYKGETGNKKFELLLKCNWIDSSREIKEQGTGYKFVMESSYGCVKLPSQCVIRDASLIYNITNLFKPEGYQVLNVPKGRIYLNVCGPLNFERTSKNICSSSFSQVCEFSNGNFINRGSTVSEFKIVDDAVKLSYTNGMKCKDDPSKEYNTHIDFVCSKTEQGPTFVMTDKCDLFIKWNTPQACPVYDKSSCENNQHEYNDCSLTFHGQHYNLSSLKPFNRVYEIENPKNKNIKYLLNVCGSVIDSDAPCMKNSMIIMKDANEPHIKYRMKSFGKRNAISVLDKHIVIKTLSGTYCGAEGDYRSDLHLICSTEEKAPQLVNSTECTFLFRWESPSACLKETHSAVEHCLIKSSSNDISLDFAKSKQTSLKINIKQMSYVFDVCKDSYTECSGNGQCKNLSLTKHLLLSNNTIQLEMSLPKVCDAGKDINKVVFELVCDKIMYNEHFKLDENVDDSCTVKIFFYTSLVCGREEYSYQIDENENEKYLISENILNNESENCSVVNYNTGYKIYLSSLDLNIPTSVCPTALFYEHNASVVLIYPDTKICTESTEDATSENKVVLSCSSEKRRDKKNAKCFEAYFIQGPEFCKLFDPLILQKPSKSNTVTTICSVIGVIVLVGLCLFCLYKYRKYLRKSSYSTVYEKDCEM